MLDYLLAGGILVAAALYLLRYYLPGRKQAGCAKCSAAGPSSGIRSILPGAQR